MLEAAIRQAARYGTQVRELEDAGMEEERRKVRKAYRHFLWNTCAIMGNRLQRIVSDAYWIEYCR